MTHSTTDAAPGLEELRPLVGKWHTEGRQLESALGPASPFVAVESFEWLEGGRFLVHRLDGKLGERPSACLEVFGSNDARELYGQAFYSDGNTTTWQVEAAHHTVSLSGTWTREGQQWRVRYSGRVIEEGNALEAKWEHSRDGREWTTFLETRATKAQPLPNTSVGT
jgi:hypothetical protein